MKRFFLTLILTAVTVSVLANFMPRNFADAAEQSKGTVCVYCAETELKGAACNGFIVQCNPSELRQVLSKCRGVAGISVSFDGTIADVEQIVRQFCLRDVQLVQTDELLVVCGFSAKLRGGVMADGRRVNLQIALRQNMVTVGSPLILGSY